MHKLLIITFLLIITANLLLANALPNQFKNRPLYAQDKIKVQLSSEALKLTDLPVDMYARTASFGIGELDKILADLHATAVIRAHRKVSDTAWEQNTGFDRWFLIEVPIGTDIQLAISTLKVNRYIIVAIPEYYAYTQFIPNDTYYPNNWGHNNTAQLPVYQGGSHSGAGVGTIGFDSHAQLAWDDSQGLGNSSVIIGIIDTGVDLAHPDLRLVTGYDFGDNDSNPQDNSADPGHGTSTSGIAAGIGNNALGICGIAAGCSVMPLKVADSAGNLGFTAIENALTYAGDHNVDVGSMSFGAAMSYGDSPSTDTALAYAYTHGVVLLAATANDNLSTIDYPANHPDVISVGAASPTGQRKSTTSSDGETWWGSNYGTNVQDANTAVDIMAPTILPATDLVGTVGYSTTNYYMWFNGTSCATPYAAGVAALLISKDPSLTPSQVRTALTSTATDMTSDGGVGWDRYTGYGLVNAQAALASLVPGMPSCIITSPAGGSVFDLGSVVTINVTATDSNGSIQRVNFYLDGSQLPSFSDTTSPYSWNWSTSGAVAGNHTITATAVDNENNTTSQQVSVVLRAPASEGFETGNFSAFPWLQSGNLPWTVQSADVYSGTYAAKSGAITHSQISTMAVTLRFNAAGTMSFFQKVSSESGFDFLLFFIDNVQQGAWSGAGSWAFQSYAVTSGNHEFKWTYYKDGSVSSGSDCGFVDHIIFPPYSIPTPASITWGPSAYTQNLLPGQTDSQTLNLGNTGNIDLNYTASVPTGVITTLNETFASLAIPTNWTQEYVSNTTSWLFNTGGYNNTHPSAAYDGTYNARLYYGTTTARITKLVTPVLDLSGTTSATLTFWHTQEVFNGNQDELRVYYKTSAGGAWNILATYTASIANWTQETIVLPSLTGTYYLAMEGKAKHGYGVCLDKIVVTKQSGIATPWITLNSASSITGTVSGLNNSNLNIGFNATGLSTGIYTSAITIISNSNINQVVTIPVTLNVTDPAPPSVPLNLSMTAIIPAGTVILSWSSSTGNPTGYNIYVATNRSFTDATLLANVPYPQTSYTDLLAHTRNKAFYRVTAIRN